MSDKDRKNRIPPEEDTGSVPTHWEPVPGQSLAAEEIRKKEEEKKAALKKKKDDKS